MKKKVKKKLGLVIGICGVALLAVGCGTSSSKKSAESSSKSDDNYVLKIADSSDLCSAPQQIAIEQGFFDKEGLDYELVKVGEDTSNFTAISTGQIDASNSLIGSVVQPLANGADIKITTGLHTGCLQILVKKGSTISSPEDLVGKKIGVSSVAGSPATFAKRYLGDAGIDVGTENSEVEFVAYNSSDLAIVLENGTVDAIALGDPTTEIIKDEYGFQTLASNATTDPYDEEYCCVAYVSANIAENHPEVAKKFTKALQEASAWIDENKAETAAIQLDKKYVDGDEAINLRSLESYNFIPSVSGAKKAFVQVAQDLQDLDILDKSVDIKKLRDNSFLDLGLDDTASKSSASANKSTDKQVASGAKSSLASSHH